MLPAIEENADHRQELLIEFNDGAPKFGFTDPARVRTLVTQNWRYSLYAGETWGELYNLATDPRETNNLWEDSEHIAVRAKLSERLNHHLARQMDESPRASAPCLMGCQFLHADLIALAPLLRRILPILPSFRMLVEIRRFFRESAVRTHIGAN